MRHEHQQSLTELKLQKQALICFFFNQPLLNLAFNSDLNNTIYYRKDKEMWLWVKQTNSPHRLGRATLWVWNSVPAVSDAHGCSLGSDYGNAHWERERETKTSHTVLIYVCWI